MLLCASIVFISNWMERCGRHCSPAEDREEKSTLGAAFTNVTIQPRREMRCPECVRSLLKENPVGREESTTVTGEEAGINQSGVTEESLSEKVTSWPHLTPRTMSSRGKASWAIIWLSRTEIP